MAMQYWYDASQNLGGKFGAQDGTPNYAHNQISSKVGMTLHCEGSLWKRILQNSHHWLEEGLSTNQHEVDQEVLPLK